MSQTAWPQKRIPIVLTLSTLQKEEQESKPQQNAGAPQPLWLSCSSVFPCRHIRQDLSSEYTYSLSMMLFSPILPGDCSASAADWQRMNGSKRIPRSRAAKTSASIVTFSAPLSLQEYRHRSPARLCSQAKAHVRRGPHCPPRRSLRVWCCWHTS